MAANPRLPRVPAETSQTLVAPFTGTVVATPAAAEEHVAAGAAVVVIEAMKMEHEIVAERDGARRRARRRARRDGRARGSALATARATATAPPAVDAAVLAPAADAASATTWPQVHERHDIGLDHRRPEAVAKRHDQGRRTARENLDDLLDADSFVEYGPLMFAAQEQRRSRQELIERTPADGLVGGVGAIAGEPVRGDVLRLHGPGRHAGDAQPPEEGPPVRDRRAPPAAGGAVRRGRRRAPRRRRHADHRRPGLPRLPVLRAAQRPGPAGGDRRPATASPATPRCWAAATS